MAGCYGMIRHPILTRRKLMFFSNIKDRSLPVLEQACERYALMVYEVFRGKVAFGFQSIRYSYEDSETRGRGAFTATFIPFDGIDCKATRVTFAIESKSHEEDKWWEFSDCKVEGIDIDDFSRNPTAVRFTSDGCFVVIGAFDELSCENRYTIGNSPTAHAICYEEELELEYKLSDILIV